MISLVRYVSSSVQLIGKGTGMERHLFRQHPAFFTLFYHHKSPRSISVCLLIARYTVQQDRVKTKTSRLWMSPRHSHLPPGLCWALGRFGHGYPTFLLVTLSCLWLCRWFCLVLILLLSFFTVYKFLSLPVAQCDACMNAGIPIATEGSVYLSALLHYV